MAIASPAAVACTAPHAPSARPLSFRSSAIAESIAQDKELTKRMLRAAGVHTADWLMAPPPYQGALDPSAVHAALGWPVVVKPSRQGSTVGLSIVREPAVFLFDEPFGALDEITREKLNDDLLRLFVERRFAGLFITHSIALKLDALVRKLPSDEDFRRERIRVETWLESKVHD